MTQKEINHISYKVVGCAIEVHRQIGPGLLESIYEDCLCIEMAREGLGFKRQVNVPIVYRDELISRKLRIDLLVEDLVICEIKSVESMLPVFDAQILSYMQMTQKSRGILINFNSINIAKNSKHFVNSYFNAFPKE